MDNYSVLTQKFNNFKCFTKDVSKSPKTAVLLGQSNEQWLGFSSILLQFKNQEKLDEMVKKMCDELEIDLVHKDKITRYFCCFADFIELINKEVKEKIESIPEEQKKEIMDKIEKLKEHLKTNQNSEDSKNDSDSQDSQDE
jgi:ribosomal protein S15P/S13E